MRARTTPPFRRRSMGWELDPGLDTRAGHERAEMNKMDGNGNRRSDVAFGYTLSSEERTPRELVTNARRAEEAGFEFLSISDHFHPWVSAQGHSPFVWAVLGAIAANTEQIPIGVGVTCPTTRSSACAGRVTRHRLRPPVLPPDRPGPGGFPPLLVGRAAAGTGGSDTGSEGLRATGVVLRLPRPDRG
jgi:hypothetical protein